MPAIYLVYLAEPKKKKSRNHNTTDNRVFECVSMTTIKKKAGMNTNVMVNNRYSARPDCSDSSKLNRLGKPYLLQIGQFLISHCIETLYNVKFNYEYRK